MHPTVATLLKTLLLAQLPQTRHQVMLLVYNALVTVMHALQTTVSSMLQAMPGGLAFSQDMFLNIPHLTSWNAILAQ
ncbi:hypothetical protein ACHAXS_002601 [Conticribra weissflogii]